MDLVLDLDPIPIDFWHRRIPRRTSRGPILARSIRLWELANFAKLRSPLAFGVGTKPIDNFATELLPQRTTCISPPILFDLHRRGSGGFLMSGFVFG